jgi:hypothetical protein
VPSVASLILSEESYKYQLTQVIFGARPANHTITEQLPDGQVACPATTINNKKLVCSQYG